MSHFTVMVVLDDYEDLQEVLAPYNESDEDYYVWEDETDTLMNEYNTPQKAYRMADGTFHRDWDLPKEWLVEITEAEWNEIENSDNNEARLALVREGYGGNITYYKRVIPADAELVSVSHKIMWEDQGKTFNEWVEDYYGYDPDDHLRGDRWGSLNNPNAQWDWYVLGGRWTGMLRVKDIETAIRGEKSWGMEKRIIEGFDACQVKNLDLEAMQQANMREYAGYYDNVPEENRAARIKAN